MQPEAWQQTDRPRRPKTKGDAVRIVQEVYQFNDWDDGEQAKHQRSLGLEDKQLTERTNQELKIILDRFEQARMVIFRD